MASLTRLFPRKENDKFETPPLVKAPGQILLISLTASMKFTPYELCSSIPVATVKILASKIISHGLKSNFSINRS